MTSARDTPDLVRVLRTERVLVPLLVLTLSVCHGLLGGMHQPLHPSPAAMEHPAHAGSPMEEGPEMPEGNPGSVGHTAALFFVLAAAFWLLLAGGFRWVNIFVSRPADRRWWPVVPHCPWAPTATLLQVFRL